MVDYDKHIWEGWRVSDYIKTLLPMFTSIQKGRSFIKPFTPNDSRRLLEWCNANQPYYKKHIPEVYKYFKERIKEQNAK